jgi:hypothetical protein
MLRILRPYGTLFAISWVSVRDLEGAR